MRTWSHLNRLFVRVVTHSYFTSPFSGAFGARNSEKWFSFAFRHASYKYQQHNLNERNSKKGKAEGRTWGKKITCDKSQWWGKKLLSCKKSNVTCWIGTFISLHQHDITIVSLCRRLGKNLSIYPRGDSGEPHSYDLLLQNFELLLISVVKIFWRLGGKSGIRSLW